MAQLKVNIRSRDIYLWFAIESGAKESQIAHCNAGEEKIGQPNRNLLSGVRVSICAFHCGSLWTGSRFNTSIEHIGQFGAKFKLGLSEKAQCKQYGPDLNVESVEKRADQIGG